MLRNLLIPTALTLLGLIELSSAQQPEKLDVPIMIGGDDEIDACGSTGEVKGLDPKGDGFLSVRSGPGGSHFREVDRLFNGNYVYICGESGPWLAVVYSNRRELGGDCGVATPQRVRQAYSGPCRQGWIHSRYVRVVAG